MELALGGRGCLITGASGGIGSATARLLAAEGARVGVHGRNVERTEAVTAEIAASGGVAHALTADLTSDEATDALADAALAALGEIDVLVCNAGGRAQLAPVGWEQSTLENYRETFQINLGYSVRLIQRLAPAMRERGFGRIILIASAAGLQPMGNQPDYGAVKAAMVSLAVSTAKWLRGCGVTVNAISPGAVLTPQLERYLRGVAQQKGWPDDWETIERTAAEKMMKIPVGHVGRPEHIASMIAYLASPQAAFVHGANLHINGGVIGTLT
jgi:3-oxoacyl-[acyl-carrier protein] reductase